MGQAFAVLVPVTKTQLKSCCASCVCSCFNTHGLMLAVALPWCAGLERVHETGDRRAALLAPVAETLIGDATYMACTSAATPSPAE
eukprot:scaffold216309_cov19-Tisochrysis_lutea.AAC.2